MWQKDKHSGGSKCTLRSSVQHSWGPSKPLMEFPADLFSAFRRLANVQHKPLSLSWRWPWPGRGAGGSSTKSNPAGEVRRFGWGSGGGGSTGSDVWVAVPRECGEMGWGRWAGVRKSLPARNTCGIESGKRVGFNDFFFPPQLCNFDLICDYFFKVMLPSSKTSNKMY